MAAVISKDCWMLLWKGGSNSEDRSPPSKCPICFKRPCTAEKDKPDSWWPVVKGLIEHFKREKTLTSVSWAGYLTLVKLSPEHFGSSFTFLTQRLVPGFLLVCSGFKWALQTKSCIGLGPKFSSLPDLLSAVHWEIHSQLLGFCLVLMLSGEWELFELQRLKWKPKTNQNPQWSCPWTDVF